MCNWKGLWNIIESQNEEFSNVFSKCFNSDNCNVDWTILASLNAIHAPQYHFALTNRPLITVALKLLVFFGDEIGRRIHIVTYQTSSKSFNECLIIYVIKTSCTGKQIHSSFYGSFVFQSLFFAFYWGTFFVLFVHKWNIVWMQFKWNTILRLHCATDSFEHSQTCVCV